MRHFYNAGRLAATSAILVNLSACGDIGYAVNPGGVSSAPPPSIPAPVTAPPPSPAPPPPPPPATPPLSPTVIDLSDGQAVGTNHWSNPQTDGAPISRFSCVINPPQALAFRAHLSILVNNEPLKIPQYLGASTQPPTHCFYAVHTHDASGRIHVTPAAPGVFTLGDLFEIWGQPLTNSNVAGISGLPVEVYVTDDGTSTQVEDTDWANIQLKPHREITIELGTPLTAIPNFTWTD
jgi:hypothetical protein